MPTNLGFTADTFQISSERGETKASLMLLRPGEPDGAGRPQSVSA